MLRSLSKLRELPWKLVASIVSKPAVADWLIARAKRTPYFDLPGYMNRWWLFNPYGSETTGTNEAKRHDRKIGWLPSIRIHHILREDFARDPHDHPWNARTIILKGDYDEDRLMFFDFDMTEWNYVHVYETFHRKPGDTARLKFGEYHNITRVSKDGVWTMFFTWDYMGNWGFWKDGKKIPWQEYDDAAR